MFWLSKETYNIYLLPMETYDDSASIIEMSEGVSVKT